MYKRVYFRCSQEIIQVELFRLAISHIVIEVTGCLCSQEIIKVEMNCIHRLAINDTVISFIHCDHGSSEDIFNIIRPKSHPLVCSFDCFVRIYSTFPDWINSQETVETAHSLIDAIYRFKINFLWATVNLRNYNFSSEQPFLTNLLRCIK